jgi:hypothetical protein
VVLQYDRSAVCMRSVVNGGTVQPGDYELHPAVSAPLLPVLGIVVFLNGEVWAHGHLAGTEVTLHALVPPQKASTLLLTIQASNVTVGVFTVLQQEPLPYVTAALSKAAAAGVRFQWCV